MSTKVFKKLNKYNIAPYTSNKIGIFKKSDNQLVGKIDITEIKQTFAERLYRFGLLSDIHQQSSQSTENMADFQNAITVFNNKEDVEFICTCGDLTQNGCSDANIAEIRQYANVVATYCAGTPIYTTTGNHDATQSGLNITNWKANTNLDTTSKTLNWSPSGISFYFEKPVGDTGKTDIFFFLSMKLYNFTSGTYYDTDISWLSNKLAEWGTDTRVFIFTHMFFPQRAGNFMEVYPSGNWLSGTQLTQLLNICDLYPKTIWFSGHSHWKWYLQGSQEGDESYRSLYCNVWHEQPSVNGGWAIHVAGCANPIDSLYSGGSWSRESTTSYANMASEGAIVDCYEDYFDLRGVSFKAYWSSTDYDSTYNTKYQPIGTYRIPVPAGEIGQVAQTYTVTKSISNSTSSNNNTTVFGGTPYETRISALAGFKMTSIQVIMSGNDITDLVTAERVVLGITKGYNITIPNVTGNITITATTEIDESQIEVITDINRFVKVQYNKNNATKTKAPIGVTTDTSGNSYINVEFTDISQGFKITDMQNATLSEGRATSMSILADSLNVYMVYLDSSGNEVQTEVPLSSLSAVGFYDVYSGAFGDGTSTPFGYGLNSPFTLTGTPIASSTNCYDYNVDYDGNYANNGATTTGVYGIQLNSSSKFTQANNSSWWPSGMSLCGNNSISTTRFKLRIVWKNLSIVVEPNEITEQTVTITKSGNVTFSNTSDSVTKGSSYSTTVTPNTDYTIDSITVIMGGTNISSTAVSGNTITIPNVTGDIEITVATTNTAFVATPETLMERYLRTGTDTKVNVTKGTKSPVTITQSGSDFNWSFDFTATGQSFIFTDKMNSVLQSGNASNIRITCDNIQVTCSYGVRQGGKVVTRTLDVTPSSIIGLGWYDVLSGNYGTGSTSPYGYALVSPFEKSDTSTESGGNRREYSVYKYDASIDGNYTGNSSAVSDTVYGVQFNTSSKFTSANNSSWWPSGCTLCGNNAIARNTMKLTVVLTNVKVEAS